MQQQTIDHYSKKWQLTNIKFLNSSPSSYILEAYQDANKSRVVLKFGHSKTEIISEAFTLKFYDGEGCVKLLGIDEENGVLLRSYAYPPSLKSFFPNNDEEAVSYTAEVIKKLHSKSFKTSAGPTITHWLKSLKTNGIVPCQHIDRAKSLARNLLSSNNQSVMLHGDLHHGNAMQTEQGE